MSGRRDSIRRRVMAEVRLDVGTGCWIWTGPTSGAGRGGGYPRMKLDGQTVAVHRVMYTLEHGYIPGRKQLDHVCRNRLCVRPGVDEQGRAHLEMVTHRENQKRRDRALRQAIKCEETRP